MSSGPSGEDSRPVPTDRPLRLEVTDLGPLAHACVDLRPLTVFVGLGNTGKSWLATVAYALHRYCAADPPRWHHWAPMASDQPDLPEGASAALARIAERLTAAASGDAEPAAQDVALTPVVRAAIRWHLGRQGEALGREVERCFGVDAGSRLVRREGAGRARILLRQQPEEGSTPVEHELTFGDDRWTLLSTIPDDLRIPGAFTALRAYVSLGGQPSEDERRPWTMDAIGALADAFLPSRHPAFYLPADRTGLMNAHSTVVSALIQSATMAGPRRSDLLPLLSGVRGDFLGQLVEMASKRGGRSRDRRERLQRVGKDIEDHILHGAVKVGSLPGVAYPHFTYRPDRMERQSSSGDRILHGVGAGACGVVPASCRGPGRPVDHRRTGIAPASGDAGGVHATDRGDRPGWRAGHRDHAQRMGARGARQPRWSVRTNGSTGPRVPPPPGCLVTSACGCSNRLKASGVRP